MVGQPPSADVCMRRERTIHHTREEFLTNGKNKEQLIKLLSIGFTEKITCIRDDDIQIVGAAHTVMTKVSIR